MLFTIPKGAVREFKKQTELAVKTTVDGTVEEEGVKVVEEHMTQEAASWGHAPGYLIKRDGMAIAGKVPKSKAGGQPAGDFPETPLTTLEGLLKLY